MRPKANALWEAWIETVGQHPDQTALLEAASGEVWSRRRLHEAAQALASGRLNAARGKIIAFSERNGSEWWRIFLACQASGAAALPLDPGLAGPLLSQTARTLGAHGLWHKGALRLLPEPRQPRAGTVCIKLTSGSTGQPEAIECRADHLLADGSNIVATMGLRSTDRNLGLIPFGHSYGLGNLVMPLMLQGTAVVCAEEFVVGQIAGWIHRFRPTVWPAVPSLLQLLLRVPGDFSLRPLRKIISAGAVLPPGLATQFHNRFGLYIHNFYGSSETGGIAYDRSGRASLTGRSVGRPLDQVAVEIQRSGHIRVSSRAVTRPGGRHTLPDRGSLNRWGELCLHGRVRPVANVGGRKVDPREVEATLRTLSGVDDVWVDVLHQSGRDYLVAAVESDRGLAEIERGTAQLLPDWKRPRFLHVDAHLPRNARGKLDAARLRKLILP